MKLRTSPVLIVFLIWESFDLCLCKVVTFEEFETPDGPWGRQAIHVSNNGAYRDILMAIHEEVEETTELIENIKNIFTRASRLLFTATKQQLFFGEISILLPEKWNGSDLYEAPRPNETFNTARIVIRDEGREEVRPSAPFVKQPGECGEESEFMYLPYRTLMSGNDSIYGDAAKVVVHLWGQLRWGLFEEFPSTPEDLPFYRSIRGTMEPSICPSGLRGIIVTDKSGHLVTDISQCDTVIDNGNRCRLAVDGGNVREISNGTGSLMSLHYLNSVEQFCHSNPDGDISSFHNHEAPTKHNKLCLQKSAWDVMSTSADFSFKSVKTVDVTPKFRLLHRLDKLSVIILDARNNMEENNRFGRMIAAYNEYVFTLFPTYSYLGVISVNGTASQALPCLKLWETPGFRHQMLQYLPKRPSKSSGLGNGVREALRILRAIRVNVSGSTIFVMSDGNDTISPTLDEVMPEVISSGVTIASLPFSADISENIHLNHTVDRKFTSFLEQNETLNLNRTRTYSTVNLGDEDRFIRIARQTVQIEAYSMVCRPVNIDDAFDGQRMVIRIYWEQSSPLINVIEEGGKQFFNDSHEYYDIKLVETEVYGIQSCNMIINLTNTASVSQTITFEVYVGVFVRSKDEFYGAEAGPIRARPLLRSTYVNVTDELLITLYGEVSQDERPVTDAAVKAIVTDKEGGKTMLQLKDDGEGGDIQKLDGIYSAYFTNFSSEGNYTFELVVTNSLKSSIRTDEYLSSGVASKTPAPPVYQYERVPDFERAPQTLTFIATDVPVDFQDSDYIPPSTIADLRLLHNFEASDRLVTMTWTAPGDDLMDGQANGYDLRYGFRRAAILREFDTAKVVEPGMILIGNLTNPKVSSKQEFLNLTLKSEQGSVFFFAIRAYDEAGNHGSVSNILEVDLTSSILTKEPTHYTDASQWSSTGGPKVNVTTPSNGNDITDVEKSGTPMIIYILVSVIGLVSATFLLIGFRVVSKSKVSHANLDGNTGSEMILNQ